MQLGQYIQLGILAIVSGITAHQTVATKLLHSYTTVDICSIIQSTAICMPIDCHAVFHLFGGRNAGKHRTFNFLLI